MDVDLSETSGRGHSSLVSIHGFRVQSYGKPVSPGFKKGLGRLAERGFDDPTCVVVKTPSGNRSGITHAGGRYVHPDNSYCTEVMHEMRNLGMEPPSPPFIVAPGEYTLYHEWGHHIDRTWSGERQDVLFSFRWLSRFYQLCIGPSRIAQAACCVSDDCVDMRAHASEAVVVWWQASSELFADLFEDWMRGEKRIGWDQCDPQNLNRPGLHGLPSVRIELLPGARAEDVRAETYGLFAGGIRSAVALPPVRSGLFGANTNEMVDRLRVVMERVRVQRQ